MTEGDSTQLFPEQEEVPGLSDEDASSNADVVGCSGMVDDSETDATEVADAEEVPFRVEDTETKQS